MKAFGILAAASLVFTSVPASASSDDGNTGGRPISGPLAGRVLKNSEVPVGAIIAGSLVILGGIVIGILASGGNGSSNSTNSTNN